jgi:choline-sulfatase
MKAVFALLASAALLVGCGPREQKPPNVLLISVDTLRADRLGCYGAAAVETPAIDALARSGVRFENAFSPVPLTLPAHWTLHTGTEPWVHGVIDNGMVLARPPAATLAERFSAAGYDTAAFVSAFVLHRSFGLDRGFARYDDGPAADAALDQAMHATAPADERIGRALRWLQAKRTADGEKAARPFFLWLHLFDPHAPYHPPSEFRARYQGRLYDGEVAFVDSQVARLLAELERLGVAERTVVALTADHGESLGEHGEQTHGVLLYEATLRVPLIFRLPGGRRAGELRADAAALADVAPSLLALAGLPAEPAAGGRDLFAGAGATRRLGAISEAPRRRLGWAPLYALRDGSWKYIAGPRPELYDLGADPGEKRDLLATERRRGAELARGAREIEDALQKRLAAGDTGEAGAEARAALAALGYVGVSPGGPTNGALPDPKERIAWLGELDRAYQLFAEGRLDQAEAQFRLLLAEADSPPPSAIEGLARVAQMKGDAKSAEAHYRRLLVLDPENVGALAQLLLLTRGRGDQAAAVALGRRLAGVAPRDANASRLLAESLAAAGDAAAAEKEWIRGLEASPRAGWLRLGYARFLAAAGRGADAKSVLEKLLAEKDLPDDLRQEAEALSRP